MITQREAFEEAVKTVQIAVKYIQDNPKDFKGLTQDEALKKIAKGLTDENKTTAR
jgi:hypothetical protein